MRALPAGFARTWLIQMIPKTMATIAQASAKMRPLDMFFLPKRVAMDGGRRAFVRCAGDVYPPRLRLRRCAAPLGGVIRALGRPGGADGETRYFASARGQKSSRAQPGQA